MHEKIVKLIYLYDLTNKEISEVLGYSKGHVSNKMNPYYVAKFTNSDQVKILGYLVDKYKELLFESKKIR